MPRRRTTKRALFASPLLAAVGGCASAPSVPLFGAAFPDWLLCIAGGVAGTAIVHVLLSRRGRLSVLSPLAVSYCALSAAIAMALWLVFFPH